MSELDETSLRISAVLDQLRFPAILWQLIAEANYYGADWRTSTEIGRLPAGTYIDIAAVVTMITTSEPPMPRWVRPTEPLAVKMPLPEPRTPRPTLMVHQLRPIAATSPQH